MTATATAAVVDRRPPVVIAQGHGWASPEAFWEERVQRAAHPLAYPALRSARDLPVVRVPRIGVVVSDAELAREVLLDLDHFSKVGPGAPSDLWTPVLGPSVLLNMEGAEHAALRRALGPLFSPRAVRELVAADGDRGAGVLPELTRRLAAGETVDLASAVGAQAGAVICGMVGLPPTDEAVRSSMAAAQTITGMVRLHRHGLTRSQVAQARAVLERLTAPARAAYRAGDPATVPGRMRDLGLSEREAMGAVGAFVLTGTETIQSFVPRLVAIAHDTGWTTRLLADDAALRRRAVEEGLRVTVPTPAMLRSVRADTSVGGVPVTAGDRVVIATVNCCRAGGGFDPDRPIEPAVRHLWFGAGPHFCLGMPLAMAQVDAVLDALGSSDGRACAGGGTTPRGARRAGPRVRLAGARPAGRGRRRASGPDVGPGAGGVVKHLVDELLDVARGTPDVVALRWFGGRDGGRVREEVTFGDLAERVERTAAGLRAQGMEPGDRVLFSIRPRPEGVVLCLAVLRAGGAVVFVDPGSTPELFVARIAAARPRWAATEALLYAASSGPLRGIARSRGLLLPDYGRLPVRHLYTGRWLPGVPRGAHRVARLGAVPGTVPAPEGTAEADREALVVFTSGTTSDPKAVVHTARTLGGMLDLFAQVGDLKSGQRAHTDQMFLGLPAIIAGGTWEIPAKAPKDAPEAFARGVAGADSSFLVPADVTALLDVLEAGSKVRSSTGPAASAAGPAVLAVGAAPVTVALLERGRRVLPGTRWLAVYGATEILPAAVTGADEKIAAAAAGDLVGRPLGGIGVRIDAAAARDPGDSVDPDDEREVGELVLTGPSLMAGYLADLDAGRPRAVEHRTGDLAYRDAEGRIVLVGRNRDMIIRGTVNIYPGLFEPRLRELPGVADAVLVGVPVPDGDERVVLVVTAEGVTAAGGTRDADAAPVVRAGTELARAVAGQVAQVLDHGALPDLVVEATHVPVAGRSRKPDRRALVNLVSPLTGTVRA